MGFTRRKQSGDELCCSFCRKREDTVGKLIANPSDYPRAYICDECISVCRFVIEDEKRSDGSQIEAVEAAGRFVQHPLALEFLEAAERWAVRDLRGFVATDELNDLRNIAGRMLAEEALPEDGERL